MIGVGGLVPRIDRPGFVMIHERQNVITGALVPLSPPVEIHVDDLDWLMRLWEDSDCTDFELWRAGASSSVCGYWISEPTRTGAP